MFNPIKLILIEKTTMVNAGRRKCKFTEELRRNYPNFSAGRTEFEAKCKTCETYVSIANSGYCLFIHFYEFKLKLTIIKKLK